MLPLQSAVVAIGITLLTGNFLVFIHLYMCIYIYIYIYALVDSIRVIFLQNSIYKPLVQWRHFIFFGVAIEFVCTIEINSMLQHLVSSKTCINYFPSVENVRCIIISVYADYKNVGVRSGRLHDTAG